MIKAYVLIGTEGRDPNIIASDLINIKEIENIHLIYGEYDLLALVKTKNVIDLRETAIKKIYEVRGVIKASSLIVAE